MRPRSCFVYQILIAACFGLGLCAGVSAQSEIAKFGAMGDSLTDEYFEQGFGSYADSWTELLVLHRGIDMGRTAVEAGQPGGTWGEPRRTGYRHNWARYGATTAAMLSNGQHTGLANDAVTYGVSHAALFIGVNDFSPWFGCYGNIYNGNWSQAQIDSWVAGRISNITSALDTVVPAGVQLVVVNIPDPSIMQFVWSQYPDPNRRDAAAAAVAQANADIRDLAEQYELALVDVYALTKAAFGPNADQHEYLYVGGVGIELLVASGTNPLAAWVADGVHPRTVLQGMFANVVLAALNQAYGADVDLFTEEELLVNAGIAYGGEDTLAERIGAYSDYVAVFGHPGDIDLDGDVDWNDFDLFADCLAGPEAGIGGDCSAADLDDDLDGDLADFAVFQQIFGDE